MAISLLAAFDKFPMEAGLIGRILAGYATLEIDLLNCCNAVRDDFDASLKAMFRIRGETGRIDVADALCRQLYQKIGLGSQLEMAIGDMRHCLKIRNEYAHCAWHDDYSGTLGYLNIEELAKRNRHIPDFSGLKKRNVDISLLGEQISFMEKTSERLIWINQEGRRLFGKLSNNAYSWPRQNQQPPLHTP